MTLYCGAYLPDNDLTGSPFVGALTKVAANLTRMRQHPLQKRGPHVDLYFLIPTEREIPDFKGMRFHSWDQEHNTLRMESSVPPHMVESRHGMAYVIAAMKDAVDNASDFFLSQNILFDRNGYDLMINDLMEVPA